MRVLLDPAGVGKSMRLCEATRILLTATRLAIERYDQMKLAMSRLDYEDLQFRCGRFLRMNTCGPPLHSGSGMSW